MNQEISFGQIVKEHRRALGLTQAELARRVGCATVTIRKIEYDALRPSQQIAELLAKALNIPLEERAKFVRLARAALRDTPEPPPLPTPSPLPEEIGQEDLSGRAIRGYELGERIGAGGFGAVYRAVQPRIEREVAIKIILPQYADHPDFIRRFEAEAQLVARLEHPYIVPLYDYWREPGVAYLVMRMLRGGSLEGALNDGPLPLETVSVLLEQVGAALHAAHRVGVIHRDLKPANVLLDEDGNGYLADFGIAKNLSDPGLENLTQAGAMVGSPAYASPEQIRAESVMPQADIYCLGILLYELLTGQRPFQGPTPIDYIMQHLNEPLPSFPAQPALDRVIRRATAKDPLERYPDVPSLLADFRQAVTVEGKMTVAVDEIPYRISLLDEELENPYKGLRPFGEADAGDFFGREMLIQELLTRLAEAGDPAAGSRQDLTRFLAVVGPSGSGKSSVVKAGLIPALRRGGLPGSENWFIVDLLPGAHPFEELEAALLRIAVNPPESLLTQLREDERGLSRAVRRVLPADPNVELVLVIDQFEEVFTQVADESTRAHLLDSLVTAVLDERSRLRVVITLRADFTDRPLQYVDFGELVRQRTAFVLPLTPDELEQAIVGPTARGGLTMEAGLASTIIQDVGDQPGMLPLLQYALTELFERREGRMLTLAAYRDSDGVTGALARRAEELYANLDEAAQEAARQLFLRLVTLGEGTEDTRRRVLRAELETLEVSETSRVLDEVIEQYGRYRLLTFDHDPLTRGPTVEVAHEALLREWGRLRGWLETSRDDVRMQRLLAAATAEWDTAGREPSYLLRGARLTQFEDWAEGSAVALTQNERTYLDASLTERQARQSKEATRLAREAALEQRSRTILRTLVAVMALATVIALTLTAFAFNQRRDALEAYSLSLAANAQHAMSVKDTPSGLVLALAANRIDRPPAESQRTLLDAAYAPGPRRRFEAAEMFDSVDGPPLSVAISPDGRTALTGLLDGTVILWNLETGQEIRRFTGHAPGAYDDLQRIYSGVNDLAFSPDGKTALSGAHDATVILWDVAAGQEIRRFERHSGPVRTVAFSPDGRAALSGGLSGASRLDPGELILWDIETGREIRRFEGSTAAVVGAAFSPDGRTVIASSGEVDYISAVGEQTYSLILWEVETGEIIHRFEGIERDLPGVAISPDSRLALTASNDHNLYLWDLETGERIDTWEGHKNGVKGVVFSPDGRRVVSGGADGELILWDLGKRELLARFNVHTGQANDIAVSPDGRVALSGSYDGTIILWDLVNAAEINRFEGHLAPVLDVAFNPDGKTFLSASGVPDPAAPLIEEDSLRLWNLQTGEQIGALDLHLSELFEVDISPDGRRALSALMQEQSVRLWDLETGREIRRFMGHKAPVNNVAFTPDGRRGLSGSIDGTLILWDLETGAVTHHFTGHEGGVWSLAVSPDGRTALSGADDRLMIWWDLETGAEIRRFAGHGETVTGIAFSPDGRLALSGDSEGLLIEWDLETGGEIRRFVGHGGVGRFGRTRVVYTPDGKTALSSGWDGTLALWDVSTMLNTGLETGQEIRRFRGHDSDFIFDIAISPDGHTALSGATDQTIIQWRLDTPTPAELFDWIAANRYVRELSCDERDLYRIEPLCEE